MIDYRIISSRSKGNATVIGGEVLIDAGVPFKKLQPYIKTLRLVLLTHAHGDHFCPSTIKALARERPSLRFLCGPWLYDKLIDCNVFKFQIDRLLPGETASYTAGDSIYAAGCSITMEQAFHDVINCGYKIFLPTGEKLFYMTDTNSLEHIEAKDFSLYLVEADYTQSEIKQRIKEKTDAGEYVYEYDVVQNHLSQESALDWLYKNMNQNSRYILMHQHEG